MEITYCCCVIIYSYNIYNITALTLNNRCLHSKNNKIVAKNIILMYNKALSIVNDFIGVFILKKIGITEVVLRDGQQSLLATRLKIDDMLPIAHTLDQAGYWSIESWGGATFDSCIRFLHEDPWDRIREFKKAMPNTPQQMLLRGQNLLGYRNYADDVVDTFVQRATKNGIDVFRIFDALNDPRNMAQAIKSAKNNNAHAQATIAYTISEYHNLRTWVDLAKQIEDLGADSVCLKDMAGLLTPKDASNLIERIKSETDLLVHLHTHATTGLSSPTILKAIKAGVDNVDTAISTMSGTSGHTATETVVSMLESYDEYTTGLNGDHLQTIALYFKEIRKKYAEFEGELKGVDSRILDYQIPGGMITNFENQLKKQNAIDKLDDVLAEVPRVRADMGYIPLVTPTSQIVGSQAVLNIISKNRYDHISEQARSLIKGEYGQTPAPINPDLLAKVLNGEEPITCRPADLIKNELPALKAKLKEKVQEQNITLRDGDLEIDDLLTYALFPWVALTFLKGRSSSSSNKTKKRSWLELRYQQKQQEKHQREKEK